MIAFRTMRRDDIEAGLALCRAAGWNQLSRDWELFLSTSPDGCRVACDDDGKVMGTVTTVRYGDHFSWIGMVLVDPTKRRQSIGMRLLKESLRVLQYENTVKLDATPAGREVYLKLDFNDEYYLSRMLCPSAPAPRLSGTSARLITRDDFSAILKYDAIAFGADREKVLEWIWNGAPEYAYVIDDGKKIKGYCFARYGHQYTHIGPVVARDVIIAKELVSTMLSKCHGKPVIIDAPHHTTEWLGWLEQNGFAEQRPFMRMYLGTNKWPGKPGHQFAMLGPELG